jgi:hypothetical protein
VVDLLADPGASLMNMMTLAPRSGPATYTLIVLTPLTATVPGTISGCPNPADDHAIDWPIATGAAAVVFAPSNQRLGPGGAIAGTYAGRTDPSSSLQTWAWSLTAR